MTTDTGVEKEIQEALHFSTESQRFPQPEEG